MASRPKVICPHESVVVGSREVNRRAIGSNNDVSIRLFTKGAFSVTCRPALHAGEAKAVKSPASIAGVGTNIR